MLVHRLRETRFYPYIYRSYWHYKIFGKAKSSDASNLYFAARPNPGAGIGHQMANWNAGYWWAKQFGLKFAHIPFSTKEWEAFLGFGIGEENVHELKKKKYKVRRLPLFNQFNGSEIKLTKEIIHSYAEKKIVFIAEQDQSYKAQFGVMADLKRKFYNSPVRKADKLLYSEDHFNIAIHVRRGDIMADLSNPNLRMRYLSNEYFEKVLKQVIENISVTKPVHIYFFSQGNPSDYPEFSHYPNLHWCLDMNGRDSFLHLVFADLLITSKSSFSYKPALINNGIKICPRNFWHEYPDTSDWILAVDDGSFDVSSLNGTIKNLVNTIQKTSA